MSLIVALRLPPETPAGTSFVLMALFLGLGTGGVFAWVAELAPAERVGTISGIVGHVADLAVSFLHWSWEPPTTRPSTATPSD
jgi:MFS transporter, NNP family, nitrate/nitrite transporter